MKYLLLIAISLTCGMALGRWLLPDPTQPGSFERPDREERIAAIGDFIATHGAVLRGDAGFAGVSMAAEPSRGGGRLVVGGDIASAEDFPLLVAVITSMTDFSFPVPIRIRWQVVDKRGTVLKLPSLLAEHDGSTTTDTALRRSVRDR